jgi:hypothetical protein
MPPSSGRKSRLEDTQQDGERNGHPAFCDQAGRRSPVTMNGKPKMLQKMVPQAQRCRTPTIDLLSRARLVSG